MKQAEKNGTVKNLIIHNIAVYGILSHITLGSTRSSQGSDTSAHLSSLVRAFAACTQNIEVDDSVDQSFGLLSDQVLRGFIETR